MSGVSRLLLSLAVLLPCQAPMAAEPRPPKLLTVGFSDADYPTAALLVGEEGTTSARVLVTAEGRVATCEVSKGSGSAILDAATCEMLTTRATFRPARDGQGALVESFTIVPVVWRIPAGSAAELPPVDLARFFRSTLGAVRRQRGTFDQCTSRSENPKDADGEETDACSYWTYGMLEQVDRVWPARWSGPSTVTAVFQTGPFARADVKAMSAALAFQGHLHDPAGAECVIYSNVPQDGSAMSARPGVTLRRDGRSCRVIAGPAEISENLRRNGIGQWFHLTAAPLVEGSAERGGIDLTADRFVVRATADRGEDGTITNCRLEDLPNDGSCAAWTENMAAGPGLFAATVALGTRVRLAMITDVRPWTGALQPLSYPGQREQVVLLGGETEEACARLGINGAALQSWEEVTACPLIDDPAAFFAKLGDPRPRQSTWTLAAEPLTP